VLQNHTQSINIKELGSQEYTVDLTYLVAFGDEINGLSFYDYLEDLIAFSVKQWRVSGELEIPQ